LRPGPWILFADNLFLVLDTWTAWHPRPGGEVTFLTVLSVSIRATGPEVLDSHISG